MRSDGYVRLMLTLIAAGLLALVALEAGWLPREAESVPARFQFTPLRYGPLGNFVVRFDTATGRLERVRFPANDVVWEEIGVLPPGRQPVADPLRPQPSPPGGPPDPALAQPPAAP